MYLGNYKGNWYRIFPHALWGWKRMIVILVSVNFILCIGANAIEFIWNLEFCLVH